MSTYHNSRPWEEGPGEGPRERRNTPGGSSNSAGGGGNKKITDKTPPVATRNADIKQFNTSAAHNTALRDDSNRLKGSVYCCGCLWLVVVVLWRTMEDGRNRGLSMLIGRDGPTAHFNGGSGTSLLYGLHLSVCKGDTSRDKDELIDSVMVSHVQESP